MKEVRVKRVAGPYESIPFEDYIQSPIGLVPKKGGDQTRLIFHLSYDFKDDGDEPGSDVQDSQNLLNHFTPREACTVKYNDLDHAIQAYLKISELEATKKGTSSNYEREGHRKTVFGGKMDIKSTFRLVPLKNIVGSGW